MSALVSIIIPTHNRADMIQHAIQSILDQSYQTFEVLVVSDGSKDNTESVVKSFNDPRIRFFLHEQSKGASAARNTALRNARGKFISFLDDDDEWVPGTLQLQIDKISDTPATLGLVYGWVDYFQDGKKIKTYRPTIKGNVLPQMLERQAIGACPSIIIKREVVEKIGYFDVNLPRGNDGDYWRRISSKYTVDFIPKVIAKVNVGHADRISVNNKKNVKNSNFVLEKRFDQFPEEYKKHPSAKAYVLFTIAKNHFLLGEYKLGVAKVFSALDYLPTIIERLRFISKNWKMLVAGLLINASD